VVGKQTCKLCKDLGFDPIGECTGSSEHLTDFILLNYKDSKRILFLVGDKTKQDIPKKLSEVGMLVDKLQVYQTSAIPLCIDEYDYVVVFSPSGVDAISNIYSLKAKFVAIGKTTQERLNILGINSLVCSEPSPDGVFECINNNENIDRPGI
jgi:uroporphyrinogen-III synthase